MKRYLLTIDTNWADEIDIDGCCVLTEYQYKKFTKMTEELEENSEFYMSIGSNEFIECKWNEQANSFEAKQITEEEYRVLEKFSLTNVGFAKDFYEAVCGYDD
ncbi:MAG: hypothetical protein ACRCVJ_18745 [Clostridium sp.]|uniref:hypothetical protein n=1 Tax=Clostridium sp. TaxID=1506 RepID=UPI003F3101B1